MVSFRCSLAGLLSVAVTVRVGNAIAMTQLVPEPLGSTSGSHASQLPTGKEVAILLRGETFRYGYEDGRHVQHRAACANKGQDVQMGCTHSVIEKIIEPFERLGNTVTVVFGSLLVRRTRIPYLSNAHVNSTEELGDCELNKLVVEAYQANPRRLVKKVTFATKGQSDTLVQLMDNLNKDNGGIEGVKKKFAYILIVRNDMRWFKPFDQIQANFDRINVLARCMENSPKITGGRLCVHDTFWMMPGYLYGIFSSCIGKNACFQRKKDPLTQGHNCQHHMRTALGRAGHPDKFGWLETDRRRVRAIGSVDLNNTGSHIADLIAA